MFTMVCTVDLMIYSDVFAFSLLIFDELNLLLALIDITYEHFTLSMYNLM